MTNEQETKLIAEMFEAYNDGRHLWSDELLVAVAHAGRACGFKPRLQHVRDRRAIWLDDTEHAYWNPLSPQEAHWMWILRLYHTLSSGFDKAGLYWVVELRGVFHDGSAVWSTVSVDDTDTNSQRCKQVALTLAACKLDLLINPESPIDLPVTLGEQDAEATLEEGKDAGGEGSQTRNEGDDGSGFRW